MKSYVDITLLPNADIAMYFLWSKVYRQIHLAFVETQSNDKTIEIGVSFPGYQYDERKGRYTLGNKLRLLAPSEKELENLNLDKWLSRLNDYVHITRIRPVPENIVKYAFFKRLQPKNNNTRLARRKARREGIGIDLAIAYYEKRKEAYSQAPYIRIKSLSSDRQYHLFVAKEETDKLDYSNGFSSYGLSSTSSVPLF